MLKIMKEFWMEEDGFAVIELIIILVALIGIAILFNEKITEFVTTLLEKIDPSRVEDPSNPS